MSITRALAKKLADYDDPRSVGSRLRAKRIAPLLRLIESVFAECDRVDIVDVGGTQRYWNIVPRKFLEDHEVKITIVNPNRTEPGAAGGPFTFVQADGCDLSMFADGAFHIAHSNSVLEHVGGRGRMIQAASEIRRVAKKYFVQTPNFWFPVEPHCLTPFFHWLPRPIRIWLVMHFALGHWKKADSVDKAVRTVESARLLDRKLVRELFADAEVRTERLLLFPKSIIALKE